MFQTFPPPVLTGSGSTGSLSHLSHLWLPEVGFFIECFELKLNPWLRICEVNANKYCKLIVCHPIKAFKLYNLIGDVRLAIAPVLAQRYCRIEGAFQ